MANSNSDYKMVLGLWVYNDVQNYDGYYLLVSHYLGFFNEFICNSIVWTFLAHGLMFHLPTYFVVPIYFLYKI